MQSQGPPQEDNPDKASKKALKPNQSKNIFDTIRAIGNVKQRAHKSPLLMLFLDRKALEKVASQASIDLPKPLLLTQWQSLPAQKILPFTPDEAVIVCIVDLQISSDSFVSLGENFGSGRRFG